MNIETRNRNELKGYFVKNAIPTEGNFAELIDATLNQAEDGIVKRPQDPLSIEASGAHKKALQIFDSFADDAPAWQLAITATDPGAGATRPGFSISDGAGTSRLFIDQANGKVGIGTAAPADLLHVQGGDIRIDGGRYRRLKIVSDQYWAGIELIARSLGEAGRPHIDFTVGDEGINYGLRLSAPTNDNLLLEGGTLDVPGGLLVEGDSPHLNRDGALYRTGGQVYLTVDDNFYIRDSSGTVPFHFQTDQGLLRVHGLLQADRYVVQDGVNGGPTRGLWMWTASDSNWGLYMSQAGAGRSLAGNTAAGGAGFTSHAIRLRTYNHAGNGLIYENNAEQVNLSVRASDGLTYVRGHLGVGTTSPSQALTVVGVARACKAADGAEYTEIGHGGANGYLNTVGDGDLDFRHDGSTKMSITASGSVGIGTSSAPIARLQVAGGAIMPAPGNGENAGIFFPPDPFGGGGDRAWIRYFNRSGEATTFEMGTANDVNDHIALTASGGVGVKTLEPRAALHVNGTFMERLEVIACGNRGDWTAGNHPIMVYFRNKLSGQPVGTMIRAIQDHPSWRGHYWQGWVDADGRIRVIHNMHNTPHVA